MTKIVRLLRLQVSSLARPLLLQKGECLVYVKQQLDRYRIQVAVIIHGHFIPEGANILHLVHVF